MKQVLKFIFVFSFVSIGTAQSYWQQEVNYTIVARLDDKKHEISAFEVFRDGKPPTFSGVRSTGGIGHWDFGLSVDFPARLHIAAAARRSAPRSHAAIFSRIRLIKYIFLKRH